MFVSKTKNKSFFKYKGIILFILFLAAYCILCQVNIENFFGFKTVESALSYEKWPVTKIENIVYSKNTACAIYKKQNGDFSFDTYYKNDSDRWCFDKMTVDYKWCDFVSVAICREESNGQNYLIIFSENDLNIVKDSLDSIFASKSEKIFCTPLSDVPSTGYTLVLNENSYILQDNGFFKKQGSD